MVETRLKWREGGKKENKKERKEGKKRKKM
jgi:hypothetical protein